MRRIFAISLLVLAACGKPQSDAASGNSQEDATSTSAPKSALHEFAGRWVRHGVAVEGTEGGDHTADYRTGIWCDHGPPPCDSMNDDGDIVVGGHVRGHLEPFTTRSAKVILDSDTADLVIDDPAIFELLDDGKARLAAIVLCGDDTSFGRECGA